jgi:hypothetical protein
MCAFTAHPSKSAPDALTLDMRRRAAEIKRVLDKDGGAGGRDGLVTSVLYYWDDLPIDSEAWTAAGELLAGCAPGRDYLDAKEYQRLARLLPAAEEIAELALASADASFNIDGAYGRMEAAIAELQVVMRVLAPMEGSDDA